MTRFAGLATAGNAILITAIAFGLYYARQSAMATFDSQAAQRDWQEWREAAKAQDKNAPVHRTVPKSRQPPSLILLRDYFRTSLVTSIILTSALYWTTVLFIRGVLYGPKFEFGEEGRAGRRQPPEG